MFFGCLPCCGGCGVADGKPRTDPKDEGTWVPSGTWRGGGVTWTFTANSGDDSGETWFFYGSAATSKVGGGASTAEQRDWYNICNWYSNKTTSPSSTSGLQAAFNKRATRLPPPEAIVHIYSSVNTIKVGPATVKNAYFWDNGRFEDASELTCTSSAFDSEGGAVFSLGARNRNGSTINGGATFNDSSRNELFATVNGGAMFNDSSLNIGSSTVNGGATFNDLSRNLNASTVNGGATFNEDSQNDGAGSTVNGGATFNDSSRNNNFSIVNDGATFNDASRNLGSTVNGGATFNDSSRNQGSLSTVNGGATFNDDACSTRVRGFFFVSPCSRKFVTHPVDVPTCNGTAPNGCANPDYTCGCG